MSWKPEVIADRTHQWVNNGLRFATKQEAMKCVRVLARRWYLEQYRVTECSDPVNYRWIDGRLAFLRREDLQP